MPNALETPKDLNAELVRTAAQGDRGQVGRLLEFGADVHAGDNYALHSASANGHTGTVALLLQHGEDVHASDDDALRWAAKNGHTDTAALLLQHRADVHTKDDDALRWASRNGDTDTVALLRATEALETMAATTPRNLAYGTAAIAVRLGLEGEPLIDFVRQHVGTLDRGRAETLGLRPYLEATGMRDMAAECAEAILLPQLLLDAGRDGRTSLSKITEEETRQWTSRLVPLAGRLLLHGKDLHDVLALGKEWHIPGNSLPDELRPLRGGVWHSVIPQIETEVRFRNQEGEELPIVVKALTSQSALTRESDQLHHCVGTADYGTQCRQGKTHILSFQAGGRSLATMEVTVTGDPKAPLSMLQFRGERNGQPPKAAEMAWRWLEQRLGDGQRQINPCPEGGWGEIPMKDPRRPWCGPSDICRATSGSISATGTCRSISRSRCRL